MNGRSRNSEVFIVDDAPAMRERLRELLAEAPHIDVVGDAGRPNDAIAGILRTRPSCVLLDYQLEDGTGLDVLRAVRRQLPGIGFIVITNHATAQHRRACLDAGACCFLDKSTEFDRICEAIDEIEREQQTISNRA